MSKRNVLWLYCDELRADALECYRALDRAAGRAGSGSGVKMQTPHLDSLAAAGTFFTQAYCNSPVCVPSRTCTLTGRHCVETGVYHNEATAAGFAMRQRSVTFPEVFAAAGYTTANFGKMHLPRELAPWQTHDGAGAGGKELLAGVDRAALKLITPPGISTMVGGRYPAGRVYPADKVAANAVAFLEQVREPFLLRVSWLQPHTPVLPPAPFAELYDPGLFDGEIVVPGTLSRFEKQAAANVGSAKMPAAQVQRVQADYYGLVAWLDTQVGRVLAALDARGLRENTVIVFTSDHGVALGERGHFAKQLFTRESQRVPLMVACPEAVSAGVVREDLVQGIDLAKTLSGLTGVALPAGFGGRDWFREEAPQAVLASIGFGEKESFQFPLLGAGRFRNAAGAECGWPRRVCVRTKRFRYEQTVRMDGRAVAADSPEADVFLAEVDKDPSETVNCVGDERYTGVVAELAGVVARHGAGGAGGKG